MRLAYEDKRDLYCSNFVRDVEPNTTPIVTVNAFLLGALHLHGMREISGINMLPLVDEASTTQQSFDKEREQARYGLLQLVSQRRSWEGIQKDWALGDKFL